LSWLASDSGAPAMLRHLVHHGEIIRLSGTATDEHLFFRHDRVRDALFSDAIATMIRSGTLSDDLLAEPYFAEVIGAALLYENIPVVVVDRIRATNALALLHALRLFREPKQSARFRAETAQLGNSFGCPLARDTHCRVPPKRRPSCPA